MQKHSIYTFGYYAFTYFLLNHSSSLFSIDQGKNDQVIFLKIRVLDYMKKKVQSTGYFEKKTHLQAKLRVNT